MTTIMTRETSGGKKGSCNSRRHNAKDSRCRCLCAGRYHGSTRQLGGVEQAVRDTWEEAIQDAEQKTKAEGMVLDTSRLRKFIGLEPQPARSNPKPKPVNTELAAQGRLPLETGR